MTDLRGQGQWMLMLHRTAPLPLRLQGWSLDRHSPPSSLLLSSPSIPILLFLTSVSLGGCPVAA